MRKKTTPKKMTSKKTRPKKKKGVSITRQKEKTVLAKLKNVFDETAAKIKTILPADATTKEPAEPKAASSTTLEKERV